MFYSTATTQENFELWVMIVLLLNLVVFLTITFRPAVFGTMRNWATSLVERIWKGISSNQ